MTLRFPQIRADARFALDLLADVEAQRTHWLEPDGRYPGLDWVIRALFDSAVLPDPSRVVDESVYRTEVEPLRALGRVLDPILDQLGDAPDADYLRHSAWPAVVEYSAAAAAAFRENDEAHARRVGDVGTGPYADPHG